MCVQRGTGAFLRVVLHVYPSFLRVVLHVYPCISVCVQRGTGTFLRVALRVYPCILVCAERDWHVSTSYGLSCISLYPCVGLARFYELSFMYRPILVSLCVCRGGLTRFYELSFMYILVSLCVQRGTGTFLRVVLHVYLCIFMCAERDWHASTSCPSCISLYLYVCREGLARFYELSFMYILVSLCVQRGTGTFLRVVLHVYPCIFMCAERDWHVSTSCPSCISLYRCVCREGLARFYELYFMYILLFLCRAGAFLRVVLHVYPCMCREGLARFYELSFMYILVSSCVCRGGLTRFYELSFMYILVSVCVQRGTGTFLRVVLHVYPCILV